MYNCPGHWATGLNYMMMITTHSYRYLPFKTSLPRPKSLAHANNCGASASCPVTQRVVRLRNGPSGYVSKQGSGIRGNTCSGNCNRSLKQQICKVDVLYNYIFVPNCDRVGRSRTRTVRGREKLSAPPSYAAVVLIV